MSLNSEISRIKSAKEDIKTSINNKLSSTQTKITDEKIDEYSEFIDEITGGGKEPVIKEIKITENGTTVAPEEIDGYNPIVVAVPEKEVVLESITVTANNTTIPVSEATAAGYDGYGDIKVEVPVVKPVISELNITANGEYTAPEGTDGYSPINVQVEPELQVKTATENGDVIADSEYYGLSKVTVAVPEKVLVEKTITATGTKEASTTYKPAEGEDGFSEVTVNITPKTDPITIKTNGTMKVSEIQAEGYDGYGDITVEVPEKTVGTIDTITANDTYKASDYNLDGFSEVTVNVSSSDENAYLKKTNMSYQFYYQSVADSNTANVALLNRLKQNKITSLNYAFNGSGDDADGSGAANITNFMKALDTSALTTCNYAFARFQNKNVEAYNATIDLTNVDFSHVTSAQYMFDQSSNSMNYGKILFKIPSNIFANVSSPSYALQFSNYDAPYLTIQNNLLQLKSDGTTLMGRYKAGHILNEDGTVCTELTFKKVGTVMSSLDMSSMFLNNLAIENIIFDNFVNVGTWSNAFQGAYNLVSITGLYLNHTTGTAKANLFSTSTGDAYHYNNFCELGIVEGTTLGTVNSLNFNIKNIWYGTVDDVRDPDNSVSLTSEISDDESDTETQETGTTVNTIGYWYEKFANALGTKAASGTQTITINTTLYNSLSDEQKALITDKGYTLAYAS